MLRTVRDLAWAGAVACMIAGSAAAQVEFTNNFRFSSGQSVQPIFEGWSRLPDGSVNLHYGYLNRNYVEQPYIPVGENNHVEPGGPDRGQPTYFYPRTHRNLFTVNVPPDWDRTREVIWTLTVNGKTERAFGWLQPEWEIDPAGGARIGGRTDAESVKNQPPTLAIDPVPPVTLPSAIRLTAKVTDDGLPKPRKRKPAVGQETPPTLQTDTKAPVNVPQVAGRDPAPSRPEGGLSVTWIVWRGPAGVEFEPGAAEPKDGAAVTAARFTKPGDYVLRARASDSALTVQQDVPVAVTGTAASEQP